MRNLLPLMLILAACGGDDDAGTDAAVAKLDCPSYCTQIQANCTGANAQYPTEANNAHCLAACESFTKGTLGEMTGNTLGCRLYHSGAPAMTDATLHCPHAGPAGDKIGGTGAFCGDACASFCTLEIKACGVTGDAGGNGQYADMAACMTACNGFDKTHLYTITSSGDSLACRLYHATNAAITGMATAHCPHTAAVPAGAGNPCLAGKAPTP